MACSNITIGKLHEYFDPKTFARGLETEIACKGTFGGCNLVEGTSNGECRIYHPDDAKAAVRNHVMSGMSPED